MAQRPLVKGEQSKLIGVRLTQSLASAIEDAAVDRGIDRSSMIRELLEAAVSEHQEAAA